MLLKWITLFGCLIIIARNEQVLAQNSSASQDLEITLKIVNGHNARVGERPFQVSLQSPGHFCGGTIINKYYIVTAAHCTSGKTASKIKVVVGTVNLSRPYKTYAASKIIIHRGFSQANSFQNDISLIKVSRPIAYDNRVKPALLPKLHERMKTGTPVVVSGWGRLFSSSSPRPDALQEVTLRVTDQRYCRNALNQKKYNLYSTHLCAADKDPILRVGDCNGDSGGPLTANGNKLVGIVSWSIKDPYCGSNKYPNIYTRVSEYVSWIRNNQS